MEGLRASIEADERAAQQRKVMNRALQARASFAEFCRTIEIPGAPVDEQDENLDAAGPASEKPLAAHHQLLCDKLQLVESGAIRRMMVFMPPGSAKSTYASVLFPAWFMGRERRRNVIVATYASPLGKKIGRRMRSVIRQGAYRQIFGIGLSAESSAADQFALTNENEMMAGGILSGITGNRADLIVIDDPIKGRRDAESATVRESTRSEFRDSIMTRGKPGFRVLLIQTRWHEADLAGGILPEDYDGESGPILCRDGETWEVVNLPAEAERADDPLGRRKGEMLWPEWFPASHWAPFRKTARTWASLFQQRPTPAEGGLFKRAWFTGKIIAPDKLPTRFMSRCRAWDLAATEATSGDDPDWTAGIRMARDGPDYYIEHVERMRRSAADVRTALKENAETDPVGTTIRLPQDPGQAGVDQADSLIKFLAGYAVRVVRPTGSKAIRAEPFATQCENGNVYLVRGPWNDAFLDELCSFPSAAHDDQVDAAADAFNELALREHVPFSSQSEGRRETLTPDRDRRGELDDKPADSGRGFGSVRSLSAGQGIAF
jgi:predicted phage terminase large subunit-like protein